MTTTELELESVSYSEELAIKLYEMLHTKDIKRQTTLQWPVANKLGINQALLLEIVHNWTEYNAHKGAVSYFHEDNWWTSDTYDNWFASYPSFGSIRTLQRLFKELEDLDYIISCRPFGKGKNGTKFYRVNKAKVGMLLLKDSPFCRVQDTESRQTGTSDLPNRSEEPAKMASSTIYINIKNNESKNKGDVCASKKAIGLEFDISGEDIHPIKRMENRLNCGSEETGWRKEAANIWMAEKPKNFVDLPEGEIDAHSWTTFKRNYLHKFGDKALIYFRESLIYAREYDDRKSRDNFSWRNSDVRMTFGQWVNCERTEKIINLSQQHKYSMENDRTYADRVEGRAYGNEITDYVDVPLDKREEATVFFEYAQGIARTESWIAEAAQASEQERKRREAQKNAPCQINGYINNQTGAIV